MTVSFFGEHVQHVSTLAARDALTSVPTDALCAVDEDRGIYQWDGSAWQTWREPAAEGTLDGLADVDTTGVADGDSLVYDAGSGLWVPGAVSGGSSGPPSPDDLPASPNADDYEFNATSTSLPSGWSWFNGGTSTYNEASGRGVLNLQASGSDEWRGLVRAIPAGASWTCTLKATALSRQSSGSYPNVGIVLRDSATGKLYIQHFITVAISDTNRESYQWAIDYYSTPTSFGSRKAGAEQIGMSRNIAYYRVKKNSATSYDFQVSVDGAAWLTLDAARNVSSDVTPDQIGFAVNSRGNAVVGSLDFYRVG